MNEDTRPIMVSIQCFTYNHESYIRQCLESFVMQKTNFRFEAIVHDDASTDGTAAIVREYAEKYPEIIKPIFEIENQYSKHDGSLQRIMDSHCYGKYIACCEGDDYWIDPLKLQKQVDFMESHPDYSMTCNRTKLYSHRKGKFVGENYCYNKSQDVEAKDIILCGGLFISTCSIVLRRSVVIDGYPDYFTKCHVGDYPLQIFAAMKGNVYYFNDVMSVYRVENSSSWAGERNKISVEKRIETVHSEIEMLNGFSDDYPHYKPFFSLRKMAYINRSLPNRKSPKLDQDKYLESFKDEIGSYSLIAKIDLWMRCLRIRGAGVFCPFNLLGLFDKKTAK